MSDYSRSRDYFNAQTTEHVLTVLHDDGLYRHLQCRQPGTSLWGFDIVTWPGHLAFGGDLTPFVFRREPDMLGFFATHHDRSGINASYWGEKVVAGREVVRTYSPEKMLAHIREHVYEYVRHHPEPRKCAGLWRAVKAEVLHDGWSEHGNIQHRETATLSVRDFHDPRSGFEFVDAWEWDIDDYDWHFLLACWAIRWAVNAYTAQRTEAVA